MLRLIFAALGLYSAVGIAVGQPATEANASRVYEYPGQQGYGAEPAAVSPSPDEPKAEADAWDYQRPCDHPETPEQRDLCQQWRMAKASEDLVSWASWQFWVTAGEIGLLVATVGFTGWAAWGAGYAARETGRAADAAIYANTISRDIGIRQIRAYVNLEGAYITDFEAGKEPSIQVRVKNGGVTPAKMVKMITQVNIGIPKNALVMRYDRSQPPSSRVELIREAIVRVDFTFGKALKPEVYSEVLSGQIIIVAGSYVSYRDVFEPDTLAAGTGLFRPYHKGNRST